MLFCLIARDEAHEPAAAGLPRRGLLQGEDVEPQQLGQALPADAGVQLHPGPAHQQHPHQALRQLPRPGNHGDLTDHFKSVCHFKSAFLLFYNPRSPLGTRPRQAPSARSWSSCLTSSRCSLLTASWTMMLGQSSHFPGGALSLLPPHSTCFLCLFPSQPSGSSSS